jgi:hypothetical protein
MTKTMLSVRQERRQPASLATGDLLLVIDDFLFSIARYCRWHLEIGRFSRSAAARSLLLHPESL